MNQIVEAFLLPPGLFVVLGVISLALCSRWTGRLLFLINLTAIYLLSTPVVGTYLMNSFEVSKTVSEAEIQAFQPRLILVPLSDRNTQAPEYGGQTVANSSLERLRYGAYLHRLTGLPMLLSGGYTGEPGPPLAELGRQVLEQEFKVSLTAVETEFDSRFEPVRLSKSLLERIEGSRVLLVSHGWHMNSVGDRLRAQGLEILEAPTGVTPPVTNARDPKNWIPRLWALGLSHRAMHRRMGEFWYPLITLYG